MKKLLIFLCLSSNWVFAQWNQVNTSSCSYTFTSTWSQSFIYDVGKDSCIAIANTYVTTAPNPPERFYVESTTNEFNTVNGVGSFGSSASYIVDLNYVSDTSANYIFWFNQYYINSYNYPIPVWGGFNNSSWQNQFAYLSFINGDSASVFSYNKSTNSILQQKVFYNVATKPFSMAFVNDSTGYVGLWNSITNANIIYKTTNYGVTWNNTYTDTNSLKAIFFPSVTTGYAVGITGAVLKTSNAGASWVKLNFPTQDTLQCLHFLNNDTGYVGANNGHLYKTFDGGSNWISESSGINTPIWKIKMVNHGSAYFSSYNPNWADNINSLYKNTSALATSITEYIHQSSLITIYPNPNNGSFVIEPSNATKQTMQVYDVNGKLVLSQTINGKTSIDASSLNEGVYNISLQSNEGVVNKRLVIVR